MIDLGYPDKVMKIGPDFMKKYEDEKSGPHLGMQGLLAKSATARIPCQQSVKKELPKEVMQRLVAGHE